MVVYDRLLRPCVHELQPLAVRLFVVLYSTAEHWWPCTALYCSSEPATAWNDTVLLFYKGTPGLQQIICNNTIQHNCNVLPCLSQSPAKLHKTSRLTSDMYLQHIKKTSRVPCCADIDRLVCSNPESEMLFPSPLTITSSTQHQQYSTQYTKRIMLFSMLWEAKFCRHKI